MQTGKRTRRIQTVNKSKYKPLIIQGDSENRTTLIYNIDATVQEK